MPTRTVVCAVLALSCFASNPCLARTIRVPSEQPTILAGLTLANPGDTVLVAPGVYSGDGNENLDFHGKDIVLISEAGPEVTIIEGTPPYGQHHRGFMLWHGETRACVVDGFTVRNFHGPGGNALSCGFASSPTIRHCIFSWSSAWYVEGGGGWGGAASIGSSALVSDCRFEDNTAYAGGGAVVCGGATDAGVTFERCAFLRNQSVSYYEGGAVFCGAGNFSFVDCVFAENRAAGAGGAVNISASGLSGGTAATFERCVFRDNELMGTSSLRAGGGIHATTDGGSASLVIRDCAFLRNVARDYGGAIAIFGRVSASLSNVTIAANRSGLGSGIWLGGSLTQTPEAILDRVIIAFGQDGQEAVHCDQASFLTSVSCCDVYGNEGGDWTGCLEAFVTVNGNFSADPLFCDLGTGDLTLDLNSPCLPGQHPGGADCELIGALPSGCGEPTAVEPTTWGGLKGTFMER